MKGTGARSALGRRDERLPEVDQIVGDDAQANPALHAREPFVATAVQAMAALKQTDATFTAGAPLLSVAKPAFLLEAFTLRALGGPIGDGDALDSPGAGGVLVGLREKSGIGANQVGLAS